MYNIIVNMPKKPKYYLNEKGEFIIVEYTIDKKGRFDAQKITASGRLGDWLQQERKAQTNEGDEIKKMWQEIRNIKQKLGMQ